METALAVCVFCLSGMMGSGEMKSYGGPLSGFEAALSTASDAEEEEETTREEVPRSRQLQAYFQTAREYESRLTGEAEDTVPDSRFMITGQEENDIRVLSAASQIPDGEERTFYVIGKNFVPNGKALAEWFGSGAVYANYLEAEEKEGKDTWYAARMSVWKNGSFDGLKHWEMVRETRASCLGKGTALYRCRETKEEKEIVTAPFGHCDSDQDSLCDRCRWRVFGQEEGSKIHAVLGGRNMTFTCIDADYQSGSLPEGGMLYLADQKVETGFFGGYGSCVYEDSQIRRYFRDGFQNGCSLGEALEGISVPGCSGTDYAMSLSREEYGRYQRLIQGGGFFLRDDTGSQVWAVDEKGELQPANPHDPDYGIRPAIVLKKPWAGEAERIHWELGDLQQAEIDGQNMLFRCIDQNYSDHMENHGQTALFLCETVIPADYGSRYELREQEDGSHEYEFCPGPLVNFGQSSDYKHSNIQTWLEQAGDKIYLAKQVQIGTDMAFTGETPKGEYSSFDAVNLSSHPIGAQSLYGKLFLLSVEEAVKYKEFLWTFEGSQEENPETQLSSFSKGYWLRTPMGTGDGADMGYVYGVDLEQGQIRPERIRPTEGTGDAELDATSPFGVRRRQIEKKIIIGTDSSLCDGCRHSSGKYSSRTGEGGWGTAKRSRESGRWEEDA